MAKEFTFRGKTLPELQAMTLQQLSEIIGAKGKRKIKKGINQKMLKKIERARKEMGNTQKQKMVKTHLRNFIILPSMVGLTFGVYSGKSFEIVVIQPEMIGHYLGEFNLTRKRLQHGKAGIGATKSSTAVATRKG